MDLGFAKDWPDEWMVQVNEYLQGERKSFDLEVAPEGTDFQKSVWAAMMKIPYGETRTYSQIAAAIGRPKAMRAVGTACGKNQIPIIIPCHRVVAASGLGGFSLDLGMKKQLLALEQKYK